LWMVVPAKSSRSFSLWAGLASANELISPKK
jgi:hypothetical protein